MVGVGRNIIAFDGKDYRGIEPFWSFVGAKRELYLALRVRKIKFLGNVENMSNQRWAGVFAHHFHHSTLFYQVLLDVQCARCLAYINLWRGEKHE